MYGFHLITPEGYAVRFVIGIGENINQGAPDGLLAWCGNKIYALESLLTQNRYYIVERNLLALGNGEY